VPAVRSHILNLHLTLWRGLPTNLKKSQYFFEGGVKTLAQAWAMIQQFNAYSFSNPTSVQVGRYGIAFTAAYPAHPPAAYVGFEQQQLPGFLGIPGPVNSSRTTYNTVVVGSDCQTVQTSYPGKPSALQ
jgi:hypothetical protein